MDTLTVRSEADTAKTDQAESNEQGAGTAPKPSRQRRIRSRHWFSRTWSLTPGRLSLTMAGLLALIALLGVAAVVTADSKSDATWALVETHEPTAYDVQRLYNALSDADAMSATSFLAAGRESAELRERYERDLALAGPTLGLAEVDRSGDERVIEELAVIGRLLPAYAGMVETARANNLQGLPIGGAYLRSASGLMRDDILPAAERLFTIQTERVETEQESATQFPYLGVALALLTLALLVATQIYVSRIFRRRINLGLLTATVALVVGLLWSGVAMTMHAGRAESADPERVAVLAEARINAVQARADELLALIARGSGAERYVADFEKRAAALVGDDGWSGSLRAASEASDGVLQERIDDAREASSAWLRAYGNVRQLDENGSYQEAVQIAVHQRAKGASAPAFENMDTALQKAIRVGREQYVDDTASAAQALTGLSVGWGMLAAIAAAGVAFGLRQRIREFR